MSINFPHRRDDIDQLHRSGRYSDVEKCCLDNLAFAVSLRGERHNDVYKALLWLSQAYYFQRNYPESELQIRRAMELARQLHGEASCQFAGCLSNLGRLQFRMGLLSDAGATLDHASRLIPELVEERGRVECAVLINRAKLLMARSDLARPEAMLLEAIQLIKKEYGVGHPRQAMGLDHLAELYFAQGRVRDAERAIRKAIAIYRDAKEEDSSDCAWVLMRLGRILYATGRPIRARSRIRLALEILKRVRPLDHFDVAWVETALKRMEHGFPPFPEDDKS